jgi:hypothetical protein
MCSDVLETLVCYDQLDASNICGVERLCRRMQYIEETYRQKAEQAVLAKSPDSTAQVREYFSGKARMTGGAIISPALLKAASTQAAQDNDILKQQRKALETRALLAKKK